MSTSRRRRTWFTRRKVVSAVAAPGVFFLALGSFAPGIASTPTTGTQRVLQSVAVTMSPNGTLTAIKGTAVSSTGSPGDATTSVSTYDPATVSSQLPVRVLTSYKAGNRTGTDLSDLNGYTGPVELDLTVQNLTMHPRTITYDAGGVAHRQTALVGAPLTVVASAALKGVDPSSVVTQGDGASGSSTNGVLSQAADGTTQVQWATILAPPQLGPSATLSLVLNAKDFQAPAVDLSVQPGLVTDPSIGSLIDSAFNPASSSQLQLEQRTIGLISQVNGVLDRARSTIAQVRTTLSSASDNLGTQTVSDLKASAIGVAAQMKSLQGTVKGLGTELNGSLKQTNSTVLQQLAATVSAVDKLLGDPKAQPAVARVKGKGCSATVAAPSKSSSVYGNLLQVVSQLKGYSQTTGGCKQQVQDVLVSTVGSADTSTCTSASTSVTCSLAAAETNFTDVTASFKSAAAQALQGLDPALLSAAQPQIDALNTRLDTLTADLGTVPSSDTFSALNTTLDALSTDVSDAKTALSGSTGVTSVFDAIHANAASQGGDDTMAQQNASLAGDLCQLVQSNKLDSAEAEQLRSYLVDQSCDGQTTLSPPKGYKTSMADQITAETAAWNGIAAQTNLGDTSQGAGQAVAALNAVFDQISTHVEAAQTESGTVSGSLDSVLKTLGGDKKAVLKAINDLNDAINGIRGNQGTIVDQVNAALDKAVSDGNAAAQTKIDPTIKQVSSQARDSADQLGGMFDHSTKGLSSAAGAILSNGRSTIVQQQSAFAKSQAKTGHQISGQILAGLSTISKGVDSSTRDMGAAASLLSGDLRRVLQDLGTRTVDGGGLLGAMASSADTASSANYQLALATNKADSYAGVRNGDIAGLNLQQALSDAALQMQAQLPAFALKLPAGSTHRTVYTFHLQGAS